MLIFYLFFPGLPSPSQHYSLRVDNTVPMVTQPTLQLQPQLLTQPSVGAVAPVAAGQSLITQPAQQLLAQPPVAATQQLVPVSMIEQNGRQMLLTVSDKGRLGGYLMVIATEIL